MTQVRYISQAEMDFVTKQKEEEAERKRQEEASKNAKGKAQKQATQPVTKAVYSPDDPNETADIACEECLEQPEH